MLKEGAVVLICLSLGSAGPLFGQASKARVIKDGTILRDRASGDAPPIKNVPIGTVVEVIAADSSGWVHVRIGPDWTGGFFQGYIPRENLEFLPVDSPAVPKPVSPPSSPPAKFSGPPAQMAGMPPPGFRTLGAHAAFGIATTGSKDERAYYEGFSSGMTMEFGLRYFFSNFEPRAGRLFLGLSYQRTTLATDFEPLLVGYDDQGNSAYAVIDPLLVQSLFFEVGRTTNLLGAGSFFYLIVGIGYARHSGVAAAEWRTPSGTVLDRTESAYHDDQFPFRLKIGAVLGLSSRLGIEVGVRTDFLVSGGTNEFGFNQVNVKGGLYGFDVGLHFNL
jgi:hypothetical protein